MSDREPHRYIFAWCHKCEYLKSCYYDHEDNFTFEPKLLNQECGEMAISEPKPVCLTGVKYDHP